MAMNFVSLSASIFSSPFTPGQQRLVRFGLAAPALVAAVDLCLQETQIRVEPILECGFRHQSAVLLGTEQAVASVQRILQRLHQGNRALSRLSFTWGRNNQIPL